MRAPFPTLEYPKEYSRKKKRNRCNVRGRARNFILFQHSLDRVHVVVAAADRKRKRVYATLSTRKRWLTDRQALPILRVWKMTGAYWPSVRNSGARKRVLLLALLALRKYCGNSSKRNGDIKAWSTLFFLFFNESASIQRSARVNPCSL